MRFTFLLPAYKSAFLAEAISGILKQTFTDFNVIVSDDASPEPIKEIVDGFDDGRISYRRNPVNFGAERLVEHWNTLVQGCEGEHLIMASDDDVYDERFLEEINALIESNPDKDLFASRCRIIDREGDTVREEPDRGSLMDFGDICSFFTAPDSILCLGNYVFRTQALKAAGGFVGFPYAWKSDSATILMMAGNGCAKTSSVLFSFRMSGRNISSQKGDAEVCRKKLDAVLGFKEWSDRLFASKEFDSTPIRKNISRRLEGELRDYYRVLSFREFFRLYGRLLKERWFYSLRNKLSFVVGYFVRKS